MKILGVVFLAAAFVLLFMASTGKSPIPMDGMPQVFGGLIVVGLGCAIFGNLLEEWGGGPRRRYNRPTRGLPMQQPFNSDTNTYRKRTL